MLLERRPSTEYIKKKLRSLNQTVCQDENFLCSLQRLMFKLLYLICLWLAMPFVLALPLDPKGTFSPSQHVVEAKSNYIVEPKRKTLGMSSVAYACVQGVNLCKQANRQISKTVHTIGKKIGTNSELNTLKVQRDKLQLNLHKINFTANQSAKAEVQRAKSIQKYHFTSSSS